jgi:hypothetical protein
MARNDSVKQILSNYNPLFDGVSPEKEQRERNALREKKKKKEQLHENVPATAAAAAGEDTVINPEIPFSPPAALPSTPEAKIPPFELYVRDVTPLPPVIYMSEDLEVIGFDGPAELAKRTVNRVHDGFRKNFYKVTPELWRKVSKLMDAKIGDPGTTMDEREEIFLKLDPVTEYVLVRGWA